jgi:hypothetical protein
MSNLHQPWLDMKRCVMNLNGTVNYYLDPTNSTLKADGSAANLDGSDGYVMVEIPKFYLKYDRTGSLNTWKIRTTPWPGYTLHPAFIKDGVEVDYRYMGAYDACMWFSRSITSVADAGSGNITVTTSAQHPLYDGDVVTISGTTSYNGTYSVVSRASNTTFTVTAAFVATETGTATGYVSGKNSDNFSANHQAGIDRLASVSGVYPLVGLTRAENRVIAANNGTGWRQQDFWLSSAVQMLYLTEYGNFNSQLTLGAGNTNGGYIGPSTNQTDSPHTISGASNTWGNSSTNGTQPSAGAKPGTAYMSYRGIENFFGNCWNLVDGFNILTNNQAWVTNNSAHFVDDVSTNMTFLGTLSNTNGFVVNILPVGGSFLPSNTSGGSSSTFLTDNYFQATGNRVARLGGVAGFGASAGAFFWNLRADSSFRLRDIGARVCF